MRSGHLSLLIVGIYGLVVPGTSAIAGTVPVVELGECIPGFPPPTIWSMK